MKLETFFNKFDQFADAPDAVAKMRELLIHFAVVGKLVPNNPEEKPVGLKLSGATDSESSLPANWRAGLLGEAFNFEYGDNLPAPKRSQSGEYPVFGSNGIVGTHDTYLTTEPAIIVGRKGSAGALNIATGPSWTTDVAYFVRPPKDIDLRFTYYLFSTLRLDDLGKGIKPGLSRKEAYALPVALPPLAEQKRIVAKVDELMALCDRLEAQQQERATKHAALARASLARFADAPTPANLNVIFHPSYAIRPDDIRMSILTLAVQGLLVRQSEADGNAEDHLPRATSLQTSALPELPPQWIWARVNETGRVDLGRQRAPQHHRGPNMRPYLRVQNVYEARIDVSDVKTMNFTDTEFATFALKSGDILLNEGQSFKLVGRPAIYRGEVTGACFQNTLVRYQANSFVLPEYALVVFRAYMRNGRFQQISKQTTNIAHLSAGRFAVLEFPLPPLAEQRRIVAKVEQLMSLVDALEQQLAASRATGENLLSALVAELTGTPHNGKVSFPSNSTTGRRGRPRKSP